MIVITFKEKESQLGLAQLEISIIISSLILYLLIDAASIRANLCKKLTGYESEIVVKQVTYQCCDSKGSFRQKAVCYGVHKDRKVTISTIASLISHTSPVV